MRSAISKLERRLKEVKEFDYSDLTDQFDPKVEALQDRLDTTLDEVFGPDTIERRRFETWLSQAPLVTGGIPTAEVQRGFQEGFEEAAIKLQNAIFVLNEKLEDLEVDPAVGAIRSIQGMDLHQTIAKFAGQRFKDGHYADAVEAACKALINLVQVASGKSDLDGVDLMRRVFSASNPILRFNELANKTDRGEQEGMMHLYEGAILAFRNPRAHKLVEDNPQIALETIGFISFLAKLLDKTITDK